jgi:hypothetical protein
MAEKIGEYFVQEFVIGLGLLGGMGIDPGGEILKAILQLMPNNNFGFLLFLISILVTIVSIMGAFAMGGWIGIIAVVLAFFGGLFINNQIGAWFIVIAILLGLIAPNTKK